MKVKHRLGMIFLTVIAASSALGQEPARNGLPQFNWDRVPVSVHFGIGEGLTPEQYDFIAEHFNFITLTAGPLPRNSKYHRFTYDGSGPLVAENNPCKALWHKSNLRWDGKINSCTFDFEGLSALGDLQSESFGEIWHGQAYQEMRNQFRNDWKRISICRRCTYAYVGGNYTEVIAENFFF